MCNDIESHGDVSIVESGGITRPRLSVSAPRTLSRPCVLQSNTWYIGVPREERPISLGSWIWPAAAARPGPLCVLWGPMSCTCVRQSGVECTRSRCSACFCSACLCSAHLRTSRVPSGSSERPLKGSVLTRSVIVPSWCHRGAKPCSSQNRRIAGLRRWCLQSRQHRCDVRCDIAPNNRFQ